MTKRCSRLVNGTKPELLNAIMTVLYSTDGELQARDIHEELRGYGYEYSPHLIGSIISSELSNMVKIVREVDRPNKYQLNRDDNYVKR
jgi:hypothetical protein